jgi:glycerol-3-phosphate dehydrogenase (NAD(P)+)
MTEVMAEELPTSIHSNICALSGPNLASEIADGRPSSTVVASIDQRSSHRAQKILNSHTFRVYTNDDVVGVEVGGALKNIIAISVGISDGLAYGDNAKATLISRGLTEMARLGSACGGKRETFAGLTGMGDLIATCSSSLSRNHRVGELLAQGNSLTKVFEFMDNVAEGIDTTNAAYRLAKQMDVDMPITNALYGILFGNHTVETAIRELLYRLPGRE